MLDKKCSIGGTFLRPISADSIKLLRFLQESTLAKIDKLIITHLLNNEIESRLKFYIEYLLEKELKSVKFIEQVNR